MFELDINIEELLQDEHSEDLEERHQRYDAKLVGAMIIVIR